MCVIVPHDCEVDLPAVRGAHVEHVGPVSALVRPLLNHTHPTELVQGYHTIRTVSAEGASMDDFEEVW